MGRGGKREPRPYTKCHHYCLLFLLQFVNNDLVIGQTYVDWYEKKLREKHDGKKQFFIDAN